MIMVQMLVQAIGYGYWIYDEIFGERNTYNAYVASLINNDGIESRIVGYIMLELNQKNAIHLFKDYLQKKNIDVKVQLKD